MQGKYLLKDTITSPTQRMCAVTNELPICFGISVKKILYNYKIILNFVESCLFFIFRFEYNHSNLTANFLLSDFNNHDPVQHFLNHG